MKDSGDTREDKPQQTPRGNPRKRKKQDHRLRIHSFETNVEKCVKKREAAVRSQRGGEEEEEQPPQEKKTDCRK